MQELNADLLPVHVEVDLRCQTTGVEGDLYVGHVTPIARAVLSLQLTDDVSGALSQTEDKDKAGGDVGTDEVLLGLVGLDIHGGELLDGSGLGEDTHNVYCILEGGLCPPETQIYDNLFNKQAQSEDFFYINRRTEHWRGRAGQILFRAKPRQQDESGPEGHTLARQPQGAGVKGRVRVPLSYRSGQRGARAGQGAGAFRCRPTTPEGVVGSSLAGQGQGGWPQQNGKKSGRGAGIATPPIESKSTSPNGVNASNAIEPKTSRHLF
jgi:hypothetical protein